VETTASRISRQLNWPPVRVPWQALRASPEQVRAPQVQSLQAGQREREPVLLALERAPELEREPRE
jgi:hypothetical protein